MFFFNPKMLFYYLRKITILTLQYYTFPSFYQLKENGTHSRMSIN